MSWKTMVVNAHKYLPWSQTYTLQMSQLLVTQLLTTTSLLPKYTKKQEYATHKRHFPAWIYLVHLETKSSQYCKYFKNQTIAMALISTLWSSMFPFHGSQDLCNIIQPIQPFLLLHQTNQEGRVSGTTAAHLPPALLDLLHLTSEKVQGILQVPPPKRLHKIVKYKAE